MMGGTRNGSMGGNTLTAEVTPTPDQVWALQEIYDFFTDPATLGQAAILTGQAGSGKSTVLRLLESKLPRAYQPKLTSTTGRSALLIGGVTVDRVFSLNRNSWGFRSLNTLAKNMHQCPPNIVVDEASMVGAHMSRLLQTAIEQHSKRLLLVGDWAQARPVKDGWPFQTDLFKSAKVLMLKHNHRQTDDSRFNMALNELRVGGEMPLATELFSSRVVDAPPEDDTYVRMFAVNRLADAYNEERLIAHCERTNTPRFSVCSDVEDRRSDYARSNYPLKDSKAAQMLTSVGMPNGMPFASGCRVLIRRNGKCLKTGVEFVNGDTGYLISVDVNDEEEHNGQKFVELRSMTIQLDRGPAVHVGKMQIDVEGTKGVEYVLDGIPVTLAYAMTIHKTQGMTLPRAWVDVSSIYELSERHGLLYVALSRTRTSDDLLLSDFDPSLAEVEHTAQFLIEDT